MQFESSRPIARTAVSLGRSWGCALALAATVSTAQAGTLGVFTSDVNGFDTHTFYYDDGKEVILIDTQFVPSLTRAMLEKVHRETKSPVTAVIVTHPNPDKFNGLAYLHAQGIRSVSSVGVADAMPAVHEYKRDFWVNKMKTFKLDEYPKFANVQERFEQRKTLRLKSGETLTLFALSNQGVATQQVAVRIDATGDLVVGDLVHHKAHAWLEGGLIGGKATPNVTGWMAALDELPALSAGNPLARVYGGRGEFALVNEAVQAQKNYLRKADQITRDYVAGLGRRQSELGDDATAAKHYEALETRMAEAFPDYRYSYMVKYSVYGMAKQAAAAASGAGTTSAR